LRAFWIILLCLPGLLSCGPLPRGAAVQSEILDKSDQANADFAIYEVTRSLLPQVASWPKSGKFRSYNWIGQQQIAPVRIAPGDRISLSIWDSEENSLLTAPGQRAVALDDIKVAPDGSVFLPYLDRIKIAGRTPEAARAHIQAQMGAILPSAQVQLTVLSGRRNSVDLVGGVGNPGSYPLADQDMSVLNLISLGGGIAPAMRNPQVRLIRGGKVYGISTSRLYSTPSTDAILRGDDKVVVEEDKRYFLALGATGSEKTAYFEQDRVTALDALTMMGGIADTRADPQGVLILREYPANAVKPGVNGPDKARVVFVIDLTTADGLFSAGRFEVNPGDLVLATESPVTSVQKILALFGVGLGVINRL